MTVVATPTVSGPTTALAPAMAAASAFFPPSRSAAMLSPTDHRVIHHDADEEEEGEEGPHVEGQIGGSEQEQGSHEGQGDPDGDPERDPEIEYEDEGEEDQHRADQGVAEDSREPVEDGVARSFQMLTSTSCGASQVASQR